MFQKKIVTRYDKLRKQNFLLVFAIYQLLSGLLLVFAPASFSFITSFGGIISSLFRSIHHDAWPNLMGTVLLVSGISILSIWHYKADIMYKTLIFCRIVAVIGYLALCITVPSIPWTLFLFFGLFEIVLIVWGYLETRKLKIPPVMKSNLAMPSKMHNLTTLLWLLIQSLISILAPNFLCTILGWESPIDDVFVRWMGIELLCTAIMWIMSVRKGCTIFVYGYGLLGRLFYVICLSVLIILDTFEKAVIRATVQLCIVIILILGQSIWTFYSLEVKNLFMSYANL